MDMILVAITVASLTLAVTMSLIAWKLIRADRVRASARMEALRAMASRVHDDEDVDEHLDAPHEVARPAPVREPAFVTVDDEPIAVRATLADTRPPSWDVLHADAPHHDQFQHVSSLRQEEMFDKGAEEGVSGRRWLALAAVALLMAAGVATVSALNSPEITAAVAASRSATTTEQGMIRPLELLSLRHEREVNGTFSITGLVENPADGQSQADVVAVVYLFDGGERYFATARARLERPVLAPGDRSPFVIKVAGAGGVQRYRVGFQRGEEGSIMHVDRRGQAPDTTTEAVASEDTAAPDATTEDRAREVLNQ